jgi:serine-protein kinase ATM
MRRTHMPLVSRAACHVAHVLLTHSQVLLSPQRILQEIETSGKDLDVQGPAALQDSSCAFLSLCLEIARRDVRLYRLHLEEKALGWLSDAWQASMNQRVGRSFVTTVNAQDILLLIESIIGTTQRSNARTRTPLPESMLTDTLLDHLSTTIIRNFLLQAKLPELQEQNLPPSSQKASSHAAIDPLFMGDNQDFPPPGVLERKLSSLISRFLNNISLRLDDVASLGPSQSAQVAHQATELAVIAIVYEVLLAANCTRPTHRSVKAACKLLTRVIPLLESTSWTTEEKLLILVAMEPILPVQVDEEFPWTPLVVPNDKSGIHRETLRKILSRVDVPGVSSKTSQEAFYCVARQVLHVCMLDSSENIR